MLTLSDVTHRFGGVKALDNVSMTVGVGECHGLIGPNGAGKTTLYNVITGWERSQSGDVMFNGNSLVGKKAVDIARLGVVRSFQHNQLLAKLPVVENVALAVASRQGVWYRVWRKLRAHPEVMDAAWQVLEDFGLDRWAEYPVGELSHGVQRQTEVAISVAMRPELLLLDEPTAGLSTEAVGEMVDLLRVVAATVTVVIIEHNMSVLFDLATVVTAMHQGRILSAGTPEEIAKDREVQRVYTGG